MSSQSSAGAKLPELSAAKRAMLEARLKNQQRPSTLVRRTHGDRVPLSFAQERLFFLDRLLPGSAAYVMSTGLRLPGELDAAVLERALGEVVRRHEALRTVFREEDGAPVQVVQPFAGFTLPVEDLSGMPAEEREAEVARRAAVETARPFDLAAGPLLRGVLLRLAPREHVLLVCMHHIVSDGWSMQVLTREVQALYAAFHGGGPSPLPELGLQYADYTVWQREQAQGGVLERQLAYWKRQLAGAPELLELPTDHPRSPSPSFRAATVPVPVAPGLLAGLHTLARSEGGTVFMVVLAAFQVLLSKYAGSDDVVVGTPIAGRTRRELEELIGFFVNTLVLRTDLSGDPSFREVLRRVRETTLGAFENQEVPFEKLVAELQPERSLSHTPFVQAMLVLENAEGTQSARSAPPGGGAEPGGTTAKFDLTLAFTAAANGLYGALEYSTDLFERGTAERLVRQMGRVLEQAVADPGVRLSALALMDAEERATVVEEWNRTDAAYPRDASIHQLFADQAARAPDAVALAHEHGAVTYRQLDERANRLANHLRRLGVKAETRVGVCLERGPEMVTAILAILKAGGAYVPLDPAYPAERLRFMLADSGAAVLVTREALRDALPAERGVRIVSFDGAAAEIGVESADPPAGGTGPRALAHVMYTSGSTGTPKGVGIEHRGVVRLVRGADYARFGPDETVLQAAPASFDASTLELWGALLNGGRLALLPAAAPTLQALGEAIRRHGVTTLFLTSGLFQAMAEERLDDLAGVRQLMSGGDVLPAWHVVRVRERFPALRLVNAYGPTENTTFTTCFAVPRGWRGAAVPIGAPIANTRTYVLDRGMRPVPVGMPGELFAAGDGVARGYLGRPGLTAQRFLPDPFVPGARMYRTGDRGRWLPDGTLEFGGRLDGQVKVRGFRIEPGEIETLLGTMEGVRDCAVVVREDVPGDKRLVAYVVGGADAEALRAGLRRSLPDYMVPAAFVPLDALPLTANGKLDRRALPAPDFNAAAEAYAAPRTPAEQALAGIWAEVLHLDRVGTTDNFFQRGGHSLLAMRVASRIREVLDVELPLRALFEGPTVAELARRVDEVRRAGASILPPVVPVPRTGPLPLSFAQERLWFLHRLNPGSTAYNLPAALRLGGPLDAAAVERALGQTVRRHETLRTVFAEVDGRPVQVIAPFSGFTLPVEDLSALADADRAAAVRRRTAEEAVRPFDLAAGPLFRAVLLRLSDTDHVLVIAMHHVVSDGWSMDVLFRELSVLYTAYAEGRDAALPRLPVQYADFAVWQREHLAGGALDGQLAYWRARLAGAPELLELPVDHPRPLAPTHRGATVPIALPAALQERLEALGHAEGATLYMVLLAAFNVLLSRHGGGEDVVVGSPIAGRTRGEIEGLIGFFVNTLVLRADLSGDPDFRTVLRRVRDVTLGAYEHQDVPFEQLVGELRPERSLGHAPLFQVMFTLQAASDAVGPPRLAGLSVGGVDAGSGTAKFDLTLGLTATPDGLRGGLTYATDLFERATAERMAAHLGRLLEQVAADADTRLSVLRLMDDAERAQLLAWSGTDAAFPDHRCIHVLFEAQAARTPDALALVHGGERLTYAELDARANRLARHLAELGVGPEVRVGLCMEPGVEPVVAILAVLKAGGAYVPLDPASPPERLAGMVADAGLAVLLTEDGLRGRLPDPARTPGVRVVRVDADRAAIQARGAAPLPLRATPRSLAYVIFTSGSTGVPKGVAVEHRGVCNLVAALIPLVGLGGHSRVLLLAPLHFDASVAEIFGTLCAGAALFVAAGDDLLPGDAQVALLRAERITHAKFTPSSLAAVPAAELPGLETVVVGGEACGAELVDRWGGGRRFLSFYGPTETTVRTSGAAWAPGTGTPTLGRPLPNTRLYVLDAAGEPVPAGVPGEVYVGGVQVARGYLDRPALTAERFVPDPFGGVPGARLYRSGDRARWRADGTPQFLGRADAQVKIRGFRIEPGEIEAALRGHPSVAECAVIAREDVPGDPRLVAYVAGEADFDALRAHLRQRLPEYMVPAAFVRVDRLPLTPNDKLDRRALPAPEYASTDRFVAPRTPAEEVLAGIWAQVLGVDRVGADDSFFALGGHSLLAMRLASRVREAFGVELPLRALFEGPTVAEVALRVEQIRRAGAPALPPVVPADRSRPLPLSFAQERMWFLHRLQPESAFYNVPAVWRLEGAVDVPALERALGETIRRHEALRTVFPEADGAPVQRVLPFDGFVLPVEELSAGDEAAREAEVRRRVDAEAVRPFDLCAGPLFRPALLRVAERDHVLLLSMHHILSDEWSKGVLFRELSALYAAFRAGGESPLAPLPVQYADYAAWQREQVRGEALERQLAWWTERLAGAPALLELPTDRPRPAVQTYRGALEGIALPRALLHGLQALGRAEGATLYMVVLGAFQALLSRYTGSEDVVVGSPVAGRTRREVEELIGFFLNTLVLRTELGGDPPFREVLRRVREGTLGAFEHQDVPFERLVEALQPERSLSHAPLFQVMFVLQDRGPAAAPASPDGAAADVRLRGVGVESGTSKFDLTLLVGPHADGLRATIEYNTDLFHAGTVRRMLGHLRRVLEQVAADADVRLSALELLDDAERRQVVEGWNATDAAYPFALPVHALFEAQADRTPDAPAVIVPAVLAPAVIDRETAGGGVAGGDGRRMTYAELDASANRLAHHLVRLGVRPDDRVALCLERGPWMMVAVLGILKAGAAYVPLDPAYPAERLAYMLENSAARVLLTQSALAHRLPAGAAAVVRVDADADAVAREPAHRPRVATHADHLAYVVYTSGSTGRPKGVAMHHRPLVNLLAWQQGDWRAPAGAVTLQFATISFDASFHEIFAAWTAGGSVVLIDEALRYDPPALLELMEREGVERIFMPAVALQQLAETADARGLVPSRLREVQTAGEQLRVTEPMRRWLGALGAPLFNHYGPSETHVVTSLALEGNPEAWPLLPSIGRPIANTRCYVLDAALRPVPVGIPGELYLGGDMVARGYLGRPALTAERFIPDPFSSTGARVYTTGDRARWRADGSIEFLGRTDEQVKIRGFRIEPGEVEAVLAAHPGVREAVAVVREDAPGDRRLVAYVVAEGGAAPAAADLRTHLKQRLPEYMVPSAVVVLDALPLTPSGKVARRALPAPEGASAGAGYLAPRTTTEAILAGIYADVLRTERVDVETGFFDLGGHSLLATRVVSRIRDVLGVELPLRTLFERPAVAELAGAVEALRREDLPPLPPVVPVERTAAMALSFAQERLYFLHRLQPGSASYHINAALRIAGALDVAALERALGETVRRHEALRTTFAEVEGAPVQAIAPFRGFVLPVEELAALDEAARARAVRRRMTEESGRPFDLAAGPLFRATLLRLAADAHVLLLGMHHVVSDGWSMDVLAREMSVLYAAFAAGADSPLPELAVQYADWAAWQRAQLRGEVLERQLAWWRERLAGAPEVLELPTDRPRPPVPTQRGGAAFAVLPADVLDGFRALARAEGATLFMVVLAAFQALLSRYAGSDDVVVGTPIAGRTRRETEGLIGFFVNTLVLRTDLGGDPPFRELVRRVRDATLGAYDHQELPFEQLVAELQPERSLSHSPLFQVMFTLDEAGGGEGGPPLPGLSVQGMGGEKRTTKFDLTLTCARVADGLGATLEYSTDLFDPETAERMLAHLGRLAAQVAADPERRLLDVELLTEAERARALGAWRGTERPYPLEAGIHQLVEAQVARTPDAVALVHEGARITYAALNASANRIARRLRDRGTGRGTFVPVLAERGPHVAAAMLAAMKAGAAFVPLDARWPEERLRRVLDDLRAPVLLAGAGTEALAAALGVPVVAVEIGGETGGEDGLNPHSGTGPDDPLYAIYTSGSTGVPKGAVVPHGGIANRFHWMTETFGAPSARCVLQTTRHVYDSAVWQLFWPLAVGGRTVIPRPDGETDADYLVELIRAEGVTMTDFVPSVFNALVPELAADASARERLASLRTVIVGGEQITAETTYRFMEHFPGVGVVNLYGPTECSIGSIHHPVSPADGGRIPIGRPIANTSALILDRGGRLVPQGIPGEIHLGGRCVGLGYLGDGGRTSAVFIPNPYAPTGGERLYRTGDLGRYRPDGSIECLGRLDEQVKIRGFRIEPGEVETLLRRMRGVRDVAVVAREDRPGDRRLVAYVAGGADADELRAGLRALLPDYMVPAAFVAVDALPLTPNGKLDRRALPAPAHAGADALDEPRNYVEVQLIQLWEELLGVGSIGPSQSFFDVGGTSLVALRLFAQVNRRFGCDLPVATLFAGATVRHMADAVLAQQGSAGARQPVVALRPGGTLPPLFVVHATDRDVLAYVNLVRHLGGDQPVHGVRDLAADLARPLARMAAEHAAEIRAVQPEGPYFLAGWSYGGMVAFEVASRLRRGGAEVAWVGLLDAVSPALARASYSDAAIAVTVGVAEARRARRAFLLTESDLEGLGREAQIRAVVAHLQAQGPALPGIDEAHLDAECRMLRDRFASRRGYEPAPFDGPLALFRAAEGDEAYARYVDQALPDAEERRTLGWSRFATRPVEVHTVPGDHHGMMSEPHVRALAEHVRAALAHARSSSARRASGEPGSALSGPGESGPGRPASGGPDDAS